MIACSTISRLRNLCIWDSSLRTALGGPEIAERPAEQALSEDLKVAIETWAKGRTSAEIA
jgi:hypothetical protein